MLIAIMGDTFDKITEFRDLNATKSKLELMSDLVAITEATDKEEDEESYLFVVKPVNEDEDDDEIDIWQGSIKTMTRVFERNIKKLSNSVEASKQDVKAIVTMQAKESEAKINAISTKIDANKAAVDAIKAAVDAKIDAKIDAQSKETQAAIEAIKTEILAAIALQTSKQATKGPKIAFEEYEEKKE